MVNKPYVCHGQYPSNARHIIYVNRGDNNNNTSKDALLLVILNIDISYIKDYKIISAFSE